MARDVVVLGIPHSIQGAQRRKGNIDDPSYADLLRILIEHNHIDFIFEEASGMGPTTAQCLADSLLGGCYLDVDATPQEKRSHGISERTGACYLIDPCSTHNPPDAACWEAIHDHSKREGVWIEKMRQQDFGSALFICGMLHCLAFCYRLEAAGIQPKELHHYSPHHKLCKRPHSG